MLPPTRFTVTVTVPPPSLTEYVAALRNGSNRVLGVYGGKMVRGPGRHIATDAPGPLLVVLVTAADRDDRTTAPKLPTERRAEAFPRLSAVWADPKYRNDARDARLRARTGCGSR